MSDHRRELGNRGETLAATILASRGLEILDRNVVVGGGEVDLVVRSGRQRVVVEVRSVRGRLRIDERLPAAKLRQVSSLAAFLGIHRVDFVGVAFGPRGIDVHWLRDVATG
ncbi:MAG: YraN family protein [Acidimicrobiia bacterium]